jgi:glycosyltransferase involved in cell wall biosynthesis
MPDKKTSLAVILLTFNEEFHIAEAIDSVCDVADEIFVLDSLSTDNTVQIALSKGAVVLQRPFTNFGDQWNFAIDNFPVNSKWVLKLDPDERLSEELKTQIAALIEEDSPVGGYSFLRRLWFMGKPLKIHDRIVRLWRTGKCRFADVIVNEHPIIDGEIININGIMEHFDSRDLHHWVEKQNYYTSMLAIQKYENHDMAAKAKLFGNRLEQRMFMIKLFFKLPGRYILQWFYEMFVRGAWRSGKTGLYWTRCRIEARRMRELKYQEILNTGRLPFLPDRCQGKYCKEVLASELQQKIMENSKK